MEEAIAAWGSSLARAEAALKAREQELESRKRELESQRRELGWQRKQVQELDRVATRLAELVVEHRQELHRLSAELAQEGGRTQADGGDGEKATDVSLADSPFSQSRPLRSVAEPSPASEAADRG